MVSLRHTRSSAGALAAGCLAALALAGCSSGGPQAHGVTPGARATGSSGPAATASGPEGSPGTGAVAGAAGAAASPSTTAGLAHSGACHTGDFATHAGLATGAVREYVTKPYAAGQLGSGDTPAARTAALASRYARQQLTLAVAAVKNCPTAKGLVGVTGQNADFLATLATKLTSSTPPTALLRAAEPMLADVASQAGRIDVTLVPTVPTPAQLHG